MAGFSSLQEWTAEFIRHKDLFERKILKTQEQKGGFLVRRKDGEQQWIVSEQFKAEELKDAKANATLVCLNTPGNVKAVVAAWKKLVAHPKITVLFVNLALGEKWMLNPKVHDSIADPGTLEQGLLRLMQAANGLVDEEPKRGRKPTLFEGPDESGEEEDSEKM